jgi:hypothetical protein
MQPTGLAPVRSWQRPGVGPVFGVGAPHPLPWLLGVAAAFTLAQIILVVLPGLGLGWDETVYVSPQPSSAPRAPAASPSSSPPWPR